MKLDGKEIAQKAMAHKAENDKLEKEPREVQAEILETGSHIKEMMSFIESVHNKDPEKAHAAMIAYAKAHAQKAE